MNHAREDAFDTASRVAAGDTGARYDGVSIALHWATALLVVVQFALSQSWDWFSEDTRGVMESAHMSFGVLLAAVVVSRVLWRLMPGHRVPAITEGWVRLASSAVHFTLYALLIAEAALGFAFRWGAGRPMDFFGLEIAPMIGEMARTDRRQLRELHEWNGWAIVAIASIHALAALYHHYVLKDRVLVRMLPRRA